MGAHVSTWRPEWLPVHLFTRSAQYITGNQAAINEKLILNLSTYGQLQLFCEVSLGP